MITADRLSSCLDRAREDWRVPAIGGLVVESGGGIATAVAGTRRRGDGEVVGGDDRWHIGSCGKSVTAALYARLAERGDALWGESVATLFSELPTDPGWADVTIDDLLLHRAGVADYTPAELAPAYEDERSPADQRLAAVSTVLALPPEKPGRFRYSNRGYAIAGAAVERIARMPFEHALHAHLLDPLGLARAGFGPPPEILGHGGRVRIGSVVLGRGPAIEPSAPGADNPPVLTPAGRLHVSLSEWARFLRMFLVPRDDTVLEASSIDRLLTVPPGEGTRQAMGWAPADGLGGSFGQQGSNTCWVATALLDRERRRAAAVVVNDGRTRLFGATARLAARLLAAAA